MQFPSLEDYLEQAQGRPLPIVVDILADVETPLSAYWKLAHDEPDSFLLESVTGGEQLARYSIIGVRPRARLQGSAGKARLMMRDKETVLSGEPLRLLLEHLVRIDPKLTADLPKFCGGAVGMLSYDYVRSIENLPSPPPDDLGLEDVAMLLVDGVLVFDHARNLIRIVRLADGTAEGYEQAFAEVKRVMGRLQQPLPPLPSEMYPTHPVEANIDRESFEANVQLIRDYITAGDCIQVVPSLRFQTRVEAHPVTVYRALRSLNPSPYMFLLRMGDFDIVGASPEILVSLSGRKAKVRPIAGTRPRGKTRDHDLQQEKDLMADQKERAEHIMLVDLGRNDLGRVCEYGSVRVDELMVVERYSHVMHIVSEVTGELADGRDAVDLVRACFPAGTVSGAPKVRAMQIIDEVEGTRRGLYAGAVGYFASTGDADLAIAIRTILLKGGQAYVQAGAGIVYDSVPSREYDECVAKAQASLQAIALAQRGLRTSHA